MTNETPTTTFPVLLRHGQDLIHVTITVRDSQLWELDPRKDELLFPSDPDTFLNRFQDNLEDFTLSFFDRSRHFPNLDTCLHVLAESGFELHCIAFDGTFYRAADPTTPSLSQDRGYDPITIRAAREINLRWPTATSERQAA